VQRDREQWRAALERLIVDVEESNLGVSASRRPEILLRIRTLARAVGVPVPPSLWRASSDARVHDALMEWQSAVLDRVAPHRLNYADRLD
jgi:hypothetical protein